MNWGSLTLSDGPKGDKGGLGILRKNVDEKDVHMALLWYGQHGSDHTLHSALDHGHFDGLHLGWFNRDQEVLRDYGYGRWVNVEPKFGGRYIPENKSYCKQTIAHNTVTVDQQSQNAGDTARAEKHWGQLEQFQIDAEFGQVMSASAKDYFDGVDMRRTVILLNRDGKSPLMIDLFELDSSIKHQYDLAVHYDGQITHTNFEYQTFSTLQTLGDSNGYQHLWEVGSATSFEKSTAMVSWLMGDSYYSVTTALTDHSEMVFCRLGANDPDFNLRNEPALIIRDHASQHLFVTVYEQHGYFNESLELSEDARGTIQTVEKIYHNANADVVRIEDIEGNCWTLIHWKGENAEAQHSVFANDETFEWQGQFVVVHSNKGGRN